jgi:hypothetical protein
MFNLQILILATNPFYSLDDSGVQIALA